jgi:glutamine amidotransferase-like uncharacterized protein
MPAVKMSSAKNDIYRPYLTINTNSALSNPVKINGITRKYPYPKIAIYNGPGASHSWLWFVEILDGMGFWDIEFVDNSYIIDKGLNHLDVLLVSGGDTFAIAESLGQEGAERIKSFIDKGGLYIGSCAGAYLPLRSSLPPLNLFNLASAKISNLTKTLPEPITLPEKFCTSYGCKHVFHPVREEVKISLKDSFYHPQNIDLIAPIYGGPAFLPSEDVRTVARYTGFTEQTLFLTEPQLAHNTLIGKAAIITKRLGKGHLFLLGPHLEHPHYPKANTFIADIIHYAMHEHEDYGYSPALVKRSSIDIKTKTLWRDIKSEVSNSRIVALSLEKTPVTWQIGHKVYEPVKISAFLEAIWSRFPHIEQSRKYVDIDLLLNLKNAFKKNTQILREIKRSVTNNIDTTDKASMLFADIKNSCADYLRIYFNCKLSSLKDGILSNN